jgi:hypothetical protein
LILFEDPFRKGGGWNTIQYNYTYRKYNIEIHIYIINAILMLPQMKRKTYKFRIYPNWNQETAINILNKVGQGLPELTHVEMFLSAKQEAPHERVG